MTLVEVEKMVNGFPLTFQEEAETAKRLGLKIVDRSALEPATADESEQGEEDTTGVEETESSEEALEPQEPKKKRKK